MSESPNRLSRWVGTYLQGETVGFWIVILAIVLAGPAIKGWLYGDPKTAIKAVLSQYAQVPDPPKSAAVLQMIDVSQCPADFREAHQRLVFAAVDYDKQLDSEPKGILEGVATGFYNFVIRQEVDGGISRLENTHNAAESRMRTAVRECLAIATRYGVRFDKPNE